MGGGVNEYNISDLVCPSPRGRTGGGGTENVVTMVMVWTDPQMYRYVMLISRIASTSGATYLVTIMSVCIGTFACGYLQTPI